MAKGTGIALFILTVLLGAGSSQPVFADLLAGGKVNADFRLRYENVDQRGALRNADALTLRSRLSFTSEEVFDLSVKLEFEDVREVAGADNYDDGLGSKPQYSVVADPETTELDQGFLQYKGAGIKARFGRQVIIFDTHRFVGDVGWRQDRQTFDAFHISYRAMEGLKLTYAYIDQRNRILAEEGDLDAGDHLLHAAYKTDVGTLTAYGYLLAQEEGAENDLDSYGLRFEGSRELSEVARLLYSAEFAAQEADVAGGDFDTEYYLLEVGAELFGVTGKLGYEVLGSDDGQYGFSTPLATLHKFNGWADQFLATPDQGLADLSASLGGKLLGGKWGVIYHDFEADEETPGVDDLGDELDLLYSFKFLGNFNAGVKYAKYSAGDSGAGKVDADKLWAWVGASF